MSFKVGPFHCGFAAGGRQVTANTCAQCSGRGAGCGGDCVQEAGRCCHPALCNAGGSVVSRGGNDTSRKFSQHFENGPTGLLQKIITTLKESKHLYL